VTDRPTANHAHPACKTIEEYIFRVALPPLLPDRAFTLLWAKEHKAAALAASTGQLVTLINVPVDAKDCFRYANACTVLPPVEHDTALVYDAAHYLTPRDIYTTFERSPALRQMLATVIIPPELIDDQPPLFPSVYTFAVNQREASFDFYPDGHVSGSYTQPLSCMWWLRTNRIVGPACTLTIRKLDSYCAHHIFAITTHPCEPPTHLVFDFPGRAMLQEELLPYLGGRKYRSLDRKLYTTVMSYATSVKAAQPHQIKTRARAAAQTSAHTIPLADEFVATEYATAVHAHHMAFIPDNLAIL
jgi:hypothetical protein